MGNGPQVRLVSVLAGDDRHPHHEINVAFGQRRCVGQDDLIAHAGQPAVPVGVVGLDVEQDEIGVRQQAGQRRPSRVGRGIERGVDALLVAAG